eukprot:1159355-Pelagomonas_calceolata.AAC.8
METVAVASLIPGPKHQKQKRVAAETDALVWLWTTPAAVIPREANLCAARAHYTTWHSVPSKCLIAKLLDADGTYKRSGGIGAELLPVPPLQWKATSAPNRSLLTLDHRLGCTLPPCTAGSACPLAPCGQPPPHCARVRPNRTWACHPLTTAGSRSCCPSVKARACLVGQGSHVASAAGFGTCRLGRRGRVCV